MAADREPGATAETPTPLLDFVQGFRTLKSRAQGRLVRLSTVSDTILHRHHYPFEVCEILGEALGLASLLGATLGERGKLILQTKTDGPLGMLVVNNEAPGRLRGYAGFDADRVKEVGKRTSNTAAFLGNGYLAMTIDNGSEAVRHQGIVTLDQATLTEAAISYFRQSEQIPTFIRLAVGRAYGPRDASQESGTGRPWRWYVSGLIIQQLPRDVAGLPDQPATIDDEQSPEADEDWQRVKMLAETVEDHELLDPTLAPETLLYRLFAEEQVVAFQPTPSSFYCRCTRDRVHMLLRSFGTDELEDLKEPDGTWSVKCEFCSTSYRFTNEEVAVDSRSSN